jgi:predicted ATPase with chaperone activity
VPTLRQIQAWLEGKGELEPRVKVDVDEGAAVPDLADVVGQQQARFAVEVAAAGAHHLMLSGPPGIGKTMLAQRLPGLLPALTEEESLEVTAIHSVAGVALSRHSFDGAWAEPPCRRAGAGPGINKEAATLRPQNVRPQPTARSARRRIVHWPSSLK